MFKLYIFLCTVFFLKDCVVAPRSSGDITNIIGGFIAKKGQFPYQISLRLKGYHGTHSTGHFCGGSILDKWHIITAGHCGKSMSPPYSDYQIAVGSNNLSDCRLVKRTVRWVKVHEGYDKDTLQNDIAIIKVDKKLYYTKYIRPISLTKKKVKTGTKCSICGWGVWKEGSYEIHNEEKGAYVPIVSSKECRANYSATPWTVDPVTMVCAGYGIGGTDACQGDSGGPLICKNKLIGLTSWGYGCGRPGYPGVYTNVAHYVDWIQKHKVSLRFDVENNESFEESSESNADNGLDIDPKRNNNETKERKVTKNENTVLYQIKKQEISRDIDNGRDEIEAKAEELGM